MTRRPTAPFKILLLSCCLLKASAGSVNDAITTHQRRPRRLRPTKTLRISVNDPPPSPSTDGTALLQQKLPWERSPWRRVNESIAAHPDTAYLVVKCASMAGVTAGALTTVFRKVTAPPVRRALFFWKEALPIVVHYRFSQWWLDRVSHADKDKRDHAYGSLHRRYAEPTYNLFLELKGLYVKIGQVLSSRPDFMPVEYVRRFATLQDSIPQWPIDHVRDIVTQALQNELGLTFEQVFESMDPIALGSASIGQVHRAVLLDEWTRSTTEPPYNRGKIVAVKVMYPEAKSCFKHDFQVFRWLCRLALPTWMGLLNELERRIMTEFDYHNEADSMLEVRKNLQRSPYRRRVSVPQPHKDLCCTEVLVMEMLHGKKLVDDVKDRLESVLGGVGTASELIEQRQLKALSGGASEREADQKSSPLDSMSLATKLRLLSLQKRCRSYVDLLVDVHGYQIFIDGAFNADPHPGNILVLDDGRLGLIDYGQTRRLRDEERLAFARVVLALGQGSNETVVADKLRQSGFVTKEEDDTETLAKYATLFFDSDHESRDHGFATPQLYYASLMMSNPLTVIPDAAIFIARTSFLFRGMGTVIGSGAVRTARSWLKHAQEALDQAEEP